MPLKHPVAMLSLVAHYVMQRAGGKPGALGALGHWGHWGHVRSRSCFGQYDLVFGDLRRYAERSVNCEGKYI